jgi:hypothetical protein
MLYRETIVVCSQIHKKHINTQCGQNAEFFNGQAQVVAGSSIVAMLAKSHSLTSPQDQIPACNVPNPVRPFTAQLQLAL